MDITLSRQEENGLGLGKIVTPIHPAKICALQPGLGNHIKNEKVVTKRPEHTP